VAASIFALIDYIIFNKNYSSSNAVFVKSDSLTFLSFKIPGKIEKIYKKEGEEVKKGELLAKLETKELEYEKKGLEYQINSLNDKINSLISQKIKLQNDIQNNLKLNQNEINKLQKAIEAKSLEISAKTYQLSKLKSDYEKFLKLYKQGKISREKYESVKVAYFGLRDEINALKKTIEAMEIDKNSLNIKSKLIENNQNEVKRLEFAIASAKKSLNAMEEKLNLINQKIKDSYLYSPIDGKVAKKLANENEVVDAGMRVLSVVNPKDLYVLDLIEETKLKGIGPGCEAKIHIDALNQDFDGEVSKILPASAATFALVPRDISSGEFTKLAQRFYVRIRFKKIPPNVLVGMSGEVTIKRCKMKNEK
jgi:membrane fusion protein (multidrug efflux system)